MKRICIAVMLLVVGIASWAGSQFELETVRQAERELEEAYVVVGTAARTFETIRTGPGVNHVNPDRSPPLNSPGGIDHSSLEQQAHRRKDAAKAVAADLERRLVALTALTADSGEPDWVKQDRAQIPRSISPPDGSPGGAPFDPTTLAWTQVADATAYAVEIQCLGCCERGEWCVSRYAPDHPTTALTIPYSGPSRWRVRARVSQGYVGPASAWSYIGDAD